MAWKLWHHCNKIRHSQENEPHSQEMRRCDRGCWEVVHRRYEGTVPHGDMYLYCLTLEDLLKKSLIYKLEWIWHITKVGEGIRRRAAVALLSQAERQRQCHINRSGMLQDVQQRFRYGYRTVGGHNVVVKKNYHVTEVSWWLLNSTICLCTSRCRRRESASHIK